MLLIKMISILNVNNLDGGVMSPTSVPTSAYPSLLAFAAAWYRWGDILVKYALASLPKVQGQRN